MNGTSSLKVTVNGKKYLITGIQRQTSCKDLLCAIAKVTENPLKFLKDDSKKGEEKSLRAIYGVKTTETKREENLLETFKGDRKKVGDLKSLKIFNSLGKNAKIIARETIPIEKEITVDDLSYKRRKKKIRTKEDYFTKSEELEKNSVKLKSKKYSDKFLQNFEANRIPPIHRSVDDSDLDSYKQDRVSRLRKKKNRAHDDSDIDVYHDLFHIVIDQTKTLKKLQSETKKVRKTAWIKELQKTSQVYHVFNEEKKTETDMNRMQRLEKDDGNDSGLPSPEYDSSESQEHPIKMCDKLSHDNNTEQNGNQNIDTNVKQNLFKDKQNTISNQNNTLDEQNDDTLQNIDCGNVDKTPNTLKAKQTRIFVTKQDQIYNDNNQNELKDIKSSVQKDLKKEQEESENRMSSEALYTDKTSLYTNFVDSNSSNKTGVDHNKNLVSSNEVEEEASRKMVAFDVALLQQKAFANVSKKIDKRKLKKADISDPVLLSPNTLQRHKSLKKAGLILGVEAADVLSGDLKFHSQQLNGTENIEKKEKEKFYNKKLKEIRIGKKFRKTTNANEPEYTSKILFEDSNHKQKKTQQQQEVEEILELNVFEKKSKHKQKNKKSKSSETKSKNKDIEVRNERNSENKTDNGKSQHEHSDSITTNNIERDFNLNETRPDKTEFDIFNTQSKQKLVSSGTESKHDTNDVIDNYSGNNRSNNSTILSKNEENTCQEENSESNVVIKTSTLAQNLDQNSTAFPFMDDVSDSSSLSSLSNNRNSVVSSSSENQPLTDANEKDMTELVEKVEREQKNLDILLERLLDYNLLISQLTEELEIVTSKKYINETEEDLAIEEQNTLKEIENVKSLLRSVSDLTKYQRKEMSENLSLLERLDSDVRTKKAGYVNLKNGTWKTSSQSAPRSLIKKRNAQNGVVSSKQRGSSFV